EASRGDSQAFNINNVHIPAYGAVVLKKEEITTVDISFSCNNAFTSWGQNIYVVGNTTELGNWDTTNAVKLDPTNYPTWTGTVSGFSANTAVDWKCIKRDVGSVVWQAGANNSVTTPVTGSISSSGHF
ncbi:MAG: hypothetical protein KUG78_06930, partial [Kangiellaceae bacterium]|nr:hypothetical protein [Kangiellaceae bacterium]